MSGGVNEARAIVRGNITRVVEADGDASLLEVVRSELGARSASHGCKDGSCGACRVLVDGRVVNSCIVKWRDVKDGASIESYEDVTNNPAALQAVNAFESERPTRCRLCVGALAVTAVDLARRNKSGDAIAIDEALANATCMCTGRGSWRRALSSK
jgi:aerobic-type carbon monoxide dehydrogenase small subunit (CoxS/CutS family)